MSQSLRSLYRQWKVKASHLLTSGDNSAVRPRRQRAKPGVTLLENKTLPSSTATGLVFQAFNHNGVFDTIAPQPNAGAGNVAVAIDRGISFTGIPSGFFTGSDGADSAGPNLGISQPD